MKLAKVSIQNFRVVRELNVDLSAYDGLRRLTLLLGDNGSGKTSVLQAIALVLSLATRQTRDASQLAWNGFMADRIATLGPPMVELQVRFDDDEIEAVAELYGTWRDSRPTDWLQAHRVIEPSRHTVVTLRYEGGRLTSPQGPEGVCQFLGRYYVRTLSAQLPLRFYDYFSRLGDVFWFDQYRNLGTARLEPGQDAGDWVAGVEQLRGSFKEWWGYHSSGRGRDYISEVEQRFGAIYPGTRIIGPAERDAASAQGSANGLFLLGREDVEFDISEMSSGEQAVMALICRFVPMSIARSIVLVDELEMHLHPPQQQALLAALPHLGPDCQYIATTHSPYLEGAVPHEWQVRLERGRLCL